jgi:hypothetical protein
VGTALTVALLLAGIATLGFLGLELGGPRDRAVRAVLLGFSFAVFVLAAAIIVGVLSGRFAE